MPVPLVCTASSSGKVWPFSWWQYVIHFALFPLAYWNFFPCSLFSCLKIEAGGFSEICIYQITFCHILEVSNLDHNITSLYIFTIWCVMMFIERQTDKDKTNCVLVFVCTFLFLHVMYIFGRLSYIMLVHRSGQVIQH